MPAILMTLLPYLLAGGLALGGWLIADHRCWSSACHDQRDRADAAEQAIATAKQRATDLALLWAKTLDDNERKNLDAYRARQAAFVPVRERAGQLPSLPTLRLSADGLRVFDAASDLANATPAPKERDGADQTFSEAAFAQAWVDAADAYADAVAHRDACVATYEALRNGQAQSSTDTH